VHLAARLWRGGFSLLDAQFINDHLLQFGVYEVEKKHYQAQLKIALATEADFMLSTLSEEQIVSEYFAMRTRNAD
jgi:leucyl/phenylalanyl-tRNA--protein transferase